MQVADQLGLWAEKHLLSIRAEHISGTMNVQADWLSRTTIDHMEWYLHPDLFREITERFRTLVLDLFTMPSNSQLPRFYSRFTTTGVEGANALHIPWLKGLLCVFPILFP